MSELAQAFERAKISIVSFDPSKKRGIRLSSGSVYDFNRLAKELRDRLGLDLSDFPQVRKAVTEDIHQFEELTLEHIGATLKADVPGPKKIPDELKDLQLYIDPTATVGRGFYLGQSNGKLSELEGDYYVRACGLKDADAFEMCITAIRSYQPRKKTGIFKSISHSGESLVYFNTYIAPTWKEIPQVSVTDELPELFKKLITSLFPIEKEQRFFLSWLRESLIGRAPTYLILCGAPGSGKNRLKLVIRALHGHFNSVDGKRSTLTSNFNGPLFESTFQSFDELRIDSGMKHVMKEILNGSAAKEKKGVDATRGEDIHASMMIMNNRPRDNYIEFEDRKFVPLVLSPHNLRVSMTDEEITELTNKVEDPRHKDFSPYFLKQIASWVIKHGYAREWPNLEYKGPMFYRLSHTSMSKWQKEVVSLLLDAELRKGPGDSKIEFLGAVGFKWTTLQTFFLKKNKNVSARDLPENSSIQHFFDTFRDFEGNKIFKTKSIEGVRSDFWIKQIKEDVRLLGPEGNAVLEIVKEEKHGKANEESDGTELL